MISTNFIFTLLNISVLIISGSGYVIRQDESVNGMILTADEDTARRNSANDDKTFLELTRLVQLDESPKRRLNDEQLLRIGMERITHHQSSVHHFARHGICRNEKGKARLYAALKSKLCYTKRDFTAQLVEDLCEGPESHLDNWIAELFDINGDGIIGHFEKLFYDD